MKGFDAVASDPQLDWHTSTLEIALGDSDRIRVVVNKQKICRLHFGDRHRRR
jgi:hypothetical protein